MLYPQRSVRCEWREDLHETSLVMEAGLAGILILTILLAWGPRHGHCNLERWSSWHSQLGSGVVTTWRVYRETCQSETRTCNGEVLHLPTGQALELSGEVPQLYSVFYSVLYPILPQLKTKMRAVRALADPRAGKGEDCRSLG
jgi:hypothetical protein